VLPAYLSVGRERERGEGSVGRSGALGSRRCLPVSSLGSRSLRAMAAVATPPAPAPAAPAPAPAPAAAPAPVTVAPAADRILSELLPSKVLLSRGFRYLVRGSKVLPSLLCWGHAPAPSGLRAATASSALVCPRCLV
jgi:hypothetical protein